MNSPVTIWRYHKKLHKYLNKVGRLIVWTKIYAAPSGFEHQAPYLVGIVEFDPSINSGQVTRMPLQIVDCEEKDLRVNQKVITVVRRIGRTKSEDVIQYGIKVKPI